MTGFASQSLSSSKKLAWACSHGSLKREYERPQRAPVWRWGLILLARVRQKSSSDSRDGRIDYTFDGRSDKVTWQRAEIIYYKEAFFSFLNFFNLFVCPSVHCCMRDPVSWPGIKPGPLHGESGVLATGPLGKSPWGSILSHLFYKQHSVFKCSFPILLTYGVQGILRKPKMEYWYERF